MAVDQKAGSLTYYTPSLSKLNDGEGITLKTSGWDGDVHWTGTETVEEGSPLFDAWKWVLENSSAFPEVFESRCFRRLADYGKENSWSPVQVPAHGIYILSSNREEEELASKLLTVIDDRTEVKVLEIEELTPQHPHSFLKSFSEKKTEIFYYVSGKCAFFCALAENWETASTRIQMLRDEVEHAESASA